MKSIVLCDNGYPDQVLPYGILGIECQSFADPEDLEQATEKIDFHRKCIPNTMEKHLHAPYHDLCPGSRNPYIAEVTRYYFDYAYQTAEKLDCRSMTVHHGYVPHTSYPEAWIRRSTDFWQRFLQEHAGKIYIHMENQLEQEPDMLLRLVDSVGDERLKLNLDIGHAHCHSKMAVTEWVRKLNGDIHYVHIHQNNGQKDEHLGLMYGNIPLDDVFEALEKSAPKAYGLTGVAEVVFYRK